MEESKDPSSGKSDSVLEATVFINESNARTERVIERVKSHQREIYYKKLEKFIEEGGVIDELGNEVISELKKRVKEAGTTAYERLQLAKRAKFEKTFISGIRKRLTGRKSLLKRIESVKAENARKIKEQKGGKEEKGTGRISKKKTKTQKSGELLAVGGEENEEIEVFDSFDHFANVGILDEDEARKVLWRQIARKQIPKLAKAVAQSSATRLANAKKTSIACASLVKKQFAKLMPKPTVSARRAMKEMLMFWKKNEREERELRKRAEKEAAEKRRLEEEQREARRQAKKLNFLITQTELYSHFVGKKGNLSTSQIGASSNLTKGTDFADVEDSVLQAEAERIAMNAAAAHQEKMKQFETKPASEAAAMDFMNPSTLQDARILEQPNILQVKLKSYQLKGLTWLASLYEQGINGILADEMGLGKTVQSISLLAHLAERHNIWGPFLIISPASTLHNWQQEFAKFVPAFKVLPYWGSVQDRKVLRSSCTPYWTGKKAVTRDSPFHVMVTSYQLIVSDEAFLQKIKWQYMVLDEAQAIKSSSSIRWKTLLGFHCRNRLLLTGTPIQNSMQELWALLHFIMPTLFDSHDEFSEWFSKDIESHAENKGSLNAHQLSRLHMILKPFMLRRVKKDVENEMGEKIEKDVICEMSPRQRRIYRGMKDKLPLIELLEKSLKAGSANAGKFNFGFGMSAGGADSAVDSALMNIVMQFRKVCNHPELFEKTDIRSPLTFATPELLSSISFDPSSRQVIPFKNPIEYRLPKLVVREFILDKQLGEKRSLLELSDNSNELQVCNDSVPECLRIESDSFTRKLLKAAPLKILSQPIKLFASDSTFSMTLGADKKFSDPQEMTLINPGLPDLSENVDIPSMAKFIRDSGKLAKLDQLLVTLKAEGHRVLIYNQMTRMIDLMEEYLQFRQYSYLRLDGSTSISTRRDLVNIWQNDPSVFVFLLSTRAGGLGINLTAADTVIFYDSDWNPTVDQQAMDRAHRLGQTKQVTVYRLITRGTIEERIRQRAKQKDEIHKVVIAGGEFKDEDRKPKDQEIMSLLLDEE